MCGKLRDNKKFDGLLGKSLISSLSILLCKSDHEFIVKNKIDPDEPVNVASRACFQNTGM